VTVGVVNMRGEPAATGALCYNRAAGDRSSDDRRDDREEIVKTFWIDERGAEMVEWAVVTLIVVSAVTLGLFKYRNELLLLIQSVYQDMQKAPQPTY
jgi:hypothetical protein